MTLSRQQLCQRFQKYCSDYPCLGLVLDLSRMNFLDGLFHAMEAPIQKSFVTIAELEKDAIANPSQKRMVGQRAGSISLSPACAVLGLVRFRAGNGKGTKNMVVWPYNDHLEIVFQGSSASSAATDRVVRQSM